MAQRFTETQETMIDYLVTCAVNQGKAYRAGRDAAMAVRITIDENRRLNAHQLQGLNGRPRDIAPTVRREAERRTLAHWEAE